MFSDFIFVFLGLSKYRVLLAFLVNANMVGNPDKSMTFDEAVLFENQYKLAGDSLNIFLGSDFDFQMNYLIHPKSTDSLILIGVECYAVESNAVEVGLVSNTIHSVISKVVTNKGVKRGVVKEGSYNSNYVFDPKLYYFRSIPERRINN